MHVDDVDDVDFLSKTRHETETDETYVADGCWLCLASHVHFSDLNLLLFCSGFELVRQSQAATMWDFSKF